MAMTAMDPSGCVVAIPRHNSAPSPPFTQHSNDGLCGGYDVVLLQCRSEGVLWRGLAPLLLSLSTASNHMQSFLPLEMSEPWFSKPSMAVKNMNGPCGNNGATSNKLSESQDGSQLHECCKMGNADNDNHHCTLRCRGSNESTARDISSWACIALSILMKHFHGHIRRIAIEGAGDGTHDGNLLPAKNICSHGQNATNDRSILDDVSKGSHSAHDWSSVCYNINISSSNPKLPNMKCNNTIPRKNNFLLILLPPNPYVNNRLQSCYSRTPSSSPTNFFALHLITHENWLIQLTSLSAYISSLGGGFFLCRQLSRAIASAWQQCRIALLKGDAAMAMKCRINAGYCYVHAGKLNRGKKVIRYVLKDIERQHIEQGGGSEDGALHQLEGKDLSEFVIIRNMCHSALKLIDNLVQGVERVSFQKKNMSTNMRTTQTVAPTVELG